MPISVCSLGCAIRFRRAFWVVSATLYVTASAFGQGRTCPVVASGAATPAQAAYAAGHLSQAKDLYQAALSARPDDPQSSAVLVRILLRQNEIAGAAAQAKKGIAANPNSGAALTALAAVQMHQGQPGRALDSLKTAEAADPCYAPLHLVRAQILRLDSMYASERAEIQIAYTIDPTDPDIRHAWSSTVSPAAEIESVDQSLSTSKDIDAESRKNAQETVRSLMPLLSENNQTCKVLPAAVSAAFTLMPSHQDAKHIDGYRLEVGFSKKNGSLQIDIAASGLFISKALADENGFQPAAGDPPGTVHVGEAQIGPLIFRDCIVGVSDGPFPDGADGVIGTDMFAQWLITLDHPAAKLVLTPLPPQKGVVPGDRLDSPDLQGFTPVYHRRQYLLVPVMLDKTTPRLFVLDSGIRYSTMTSEAAHSVSKMKVNFTNAVQTVSGAKLQVYRDSFNLQFANLNLTNQNHIFELDPAAIERNTGIEVAGMIGFDILHSLVLHLDYRDGLVRFDSPQSTDSKGQPHNTAMEIAGAATPACPATDDRDRPIGSTIQAKVTGLLDAAHLKPGREVNAKVVNECAFPGCTLPRGSVLYGHVTESRSSKDPESAELALIFDHGECGGGPKKAISLTLIGLVASPDQFVGLHSVLPTEVAGSGRKISTAAADTASDFEEINLNPGGAPHTVHPGIVAGLPHLKLEPEAGLGCSTRITSTDRTLRLGVGSQLILTMQQTPQ
jgi:tetratricopeptide (TPR) repeat protein